MLTVCAVFLICISGCGVREKHKATRVRNFTGVVGVCFNDKYEIPSDFRIIESRVPIYMNKGTIDPNSLEEFRWIEQNYDLLVEDAERGGAKGRAVYFVDKESKVRHFVTFRENKPEARQ